jgi:phenylalanyl-tRNA synthetase beta chain
VKISLNWLREFVDLPESPEELRVVLDDLGLVVEGVDEVGEGLDDIVVARIDDVRAIKGADRGRRRRSPGHCLWCQQLRGW